VVVLVQVLVPFISTEQLSVGSDSYSGNGDSWTPTQNLEHNTGKRNHIRMIVCDKRSERGTWYK
jgi:hypothetical protein